MDKITKKFGERLSITMLVPNELIRRVDEGHLDLFVACTKDSMIKVNEEYILPDHSGILWTGYKYVDRINIYSKCLEMSGVVVER
jgi:hypothetical protein